MAYFAEYTAFDFDDVLLEPQHSDLLSRSEVSTATILGHLKLQTPIISANMDSVTGLKMCQAMARVGGLGIRHRYSPQKEILNEMTWLLRESIEPVPSIGCGPESVLFATKLFQVGVRAICIDIAHGDSLQAAETAHACRNMGFITVIAGNVATAEGAKRLWNSGANVIKVGIGPGSVCTTRNVTGHGVPQLSAICRVTTEAKGKFHVIADGGMRTSGDIVKALAAGADAVMLGGMLAGCDEASLRGNGSEVIYRGMASAGAQLDFRGSISNGTAEGVTKFVLPKGPAAGVIQEILGGIRSGCSYSGARSIKELQENAVFIKVNRIKAQ